MASFLARLGGLGGNPPVANAKTAQDVPDGSIPSAKRSGAGSAPGQALVSTGTGVTWQAAAGPQGPQGAPGPSFGDTSTSASAVALTPCVASVILTLPVT